MSLSGAGLLSLALIGDGGVFSLTSLKGDVELLRCFVAMSIILTSCSWRDEGRTSVSMRRRSVLLSFSPTSLCPIWRYRFASALCRLLFPLPLLERVVVPFLPCINAADGGGAVIHALSSFFDGTGLTTGGCNSLTGGIVVVGV